MTHTFKTKKLRYSNDKDKYKLYKTALEWSLIDPIVIKDKNDIRSRQEWIQLLEPYHHQVNNLITFCKRLPVTLISDDVGLGKTISAGLIVSELMARGHVAKVLVVCPKILMPQWNEELRTKFRINSIEVVGKDLLEVKPPNDFGAIITTYQSASRYLDKLGEGGFDILILDEAHKLRNLYGVSETPQVAIKFKKALSDRMFRYVLMLTATPIHNRLWDIYSLIELLTIARGHENPFGKEGVFARKYISDSSTKARRLNPKMKDEFRSVVYGYMSRTRRDDVALLFPERIVHLHKVEPTQDETIIFNLIKEPIQSLPFFVQISVLQAYVSSPHALAKQLENSAKKGNFPLKVVADVRSIVNKMKTTAKLKGLLELIHKLKEEQGGNWRVVIFTERRETQTAIENLLGEHEISCGIINGDSAIRNREIIERFRKTPIDTHVIVSTRAGSEGVNLQIANVLVNFDLPWNPMIVEQRIGRIQRLASEHAKVSIFNLILKDTFEEYIVGRLMEKLQLASHAIGDIESLLEATSLNKDDNDKGIEEKIRELVMASIEGKDVKEATQLIEKSVEDAKMQLEKEEENINDMLGGSDGVVDLGPKVPELPTIKREMHYKDFTLLALKNIGANITKKSDENYVIELDGNKETIRFENKFDNNSNSTLCRPGSPFFNKLVMQVANLSLHSVEDLDIEIKSNCEDVSKKWINTFNADFNKYNIIKIRRCFNGNAVLHVSVTNAHDKYERLLHINCISDIISEGEFDLLEPLEKNLKNPIGLGLSETYLTEKTMEDLGVSEFCRFYSERLEIELQSVKDSKRKKKKIERDFTPHIIITLVGLEGEFYRECLTDVFYQIDSEKYQSQITIIPHKSEVKDKLEFRKCSISKGLYPITCLKNCQVSGKEVLSHLLVKSDVSNQFALSEHLVTCALSNKKVLPEEVDISDVTGRSICTSKLITSALSGKKGEPDYFELCEFSSVYVLKTELKISQISKKKYRKDQKLISSVSGKVGHKDEFILCSETKLPLLIDEATKSDEGKLCSPKAAILCNWSGQKFHPYDIKFCEITGLSFHSNYLDGRGYFGILYSLLIGSNNKADNQELWTIITPQIITKLGNRNIKIEQSEISKNRKYIACCVKIKIWGGLKIRYTGVIFSIIDSEIIGHLSIGKKNKNNWVKENKI